MGKNVAIQFQECLKSGKIKTASGLAELASKELRVAEGDLQVARDGLKNSRWKWCTIQAYYVMFHAARALLFLKGYRERSHYCLMVAVGHLYENVVPQHLVDDFQTAKIMRENADYEENFSESGARKIVKSAEAFLSFAKGVIK